MAYMNKKIEKSEVDLQHEEVFLRDAKHFFDMAQSNAILDTLEANLPSLNLYELKQLSVSELLNMLGGSKSRTVLNCMKLWHVKPRNYIEPEDITHYDNTGNYYHYVDGQRYYPTQ